MYVDDSYIKNNILFRVLATEEACCYVVSANKTCKASLNAVIYHWLVVEHVMSASLQEL